MDESKSWESTYAYNLSSFESQILMCGHEHQKDQHVMMSLENKDKVLYLESDSLQQGNEQSFTLLTITDEEYYTLHKYDFL